jgi:electron transfer flavoprotein beta subunit
MGPPAACEALRECLYRGADRAILLTDRRAAASDTLATSYILSCAIANWASTDFVFCGRQAIDGDTAQVGPQLAEKLGLPQVTYFERLVEPLRPDGARAAQRRQWLGSARDEVANAGHGADTANEPRPAGVRRVMRSKAGPVSRGTGGRSGRRPAGCHARAKRRPRSPDGWRP